MAQVAVIGAGSWGTAVATLACANRPTALWARRPELALAMTESRENLDYLPGCRVPDDLIVTSSLEEALEDAEVVVMGVPSHGFRDILTAASAAMPAGIPLISLTKGVE